MRRNRIIWLAVAALSATASAVGTVELAGRIARWNENNPTPIWYFQEVEQTRFQFQGREVEIDSDIDDLGVGEVAVTYGDQTLRIPVAVPAEHDFPGLLRYRDWMRVLLFADSQRMSVERFEQGLNDGSVRLRCAIATRVPDPEVLGKGPLSDVLDLEVDEDSWGWGETMRHQWTFHFYELLPGGGFEKTTKQWPESWQSLYRRQVRAAQSGEPLPERDPREFAYGQWQHDAALRVSPRAPGISKERQALRGAGWSLPTVAAGILGFIFALAFAFAPQRAQNKSNDNPAERPGDWHDRGRDQTDESGRPGINPPGR